MDPTNPSEPVAEAAGSPKPEPTEEQPIKQPTPEASPQPEQAMEEPKGEEDEKDEAPKAQSPVTSGQDQKDEAAEVAAEKETTPRNEEPMEEAPKQESPKVEAAVEPKAESPKVEAAEEPKAESPKVEAVEEPKAESPKVEAAEEPKAESPKVEAVEEPKAKSPKVELAKEPKSPRGKKEEKTLRPVRSPAKKEEKKPQPEKPKTPKKAEPKKEKEEAEKTTEEKPKSPEKPKPKATPVKPKATPVKQKPAPASAPPKASAPATTTPRKETGPWNPSSPTLLKTTKVSEMRLELAQKQIEDSKRKSDDRRTWSASGRVNTDKLYQTPVNVYQPLEFFAEQDRQSARGAAKDPNSSTGGRPATASTTRWNPAGTFQTGEMRHVSQSRPQTSAGSGKREWNDDAEGIGFLAPAKPEETTGSRRRTPPQASRAPWGTVDDVPPTEEKPAKAPCAGADEASIEAEALTVSEAPKEAGEKPKAQEKPAEAAGSRRHAPQQVSRAPWGTVDDVQPPKEEKKPARAPCAPAAETTTEAASEAPKGAEARPAEEKAEEKEEQKAPVQAERKPRPASARVHTEVFPWLTPSDN